MSAAAASIPIIFRLRRRTSRYNVITLRLADHHRTVVTESLSLPMKFPSCSRIYVYPVAEPPVSTLVPINKGITSSLSLRHADHHRTSVPVIIHLLRRVVACYCRCRYRYVQTFHTPCGPRTEFRCQKVVCPRTTYHTERQA